VEHVLDPVGVGEGGAAGDGQGVEDAHGVLAVVDQRGEEGRLVPVLDALQDGEVQLLRVVGLVVEHAPELVVVGERHPLHRQIAEAVDIQFRPAIAWCRLLIIIIIIIIIISVILLFNCSVIISVDKYLISLMIWASSSVRVSCWVRECWSLLRALWRN
jgi:hypothetical protein